MDQYELIRTGHRVYKKSISELARETGHSRNTIKKAIRGEPWGYQERNHQPYPVLEPFLATIDQWLEADKEQPKKQRHTARRVYNRLIAEHGFIGGESTVRRYVKITKMKLGINSPGAFIPCDPEAGFEAEVDWGTAVAVIGGQSTKFKFFCMRSKYSGKHFVRAYPCERQQAFFDAHLHAFQFFGGIFPVLIYDNLTTAVRKVLKGKNRLEQKSFRKFRIYHNFEARFANPAAGHEKGGVEGLVGFSRRNYMVPVPKVDSFEDLNAILLRDCQAYGSHTIVGRENTVADLHEMEKEHLLSMPDAVFDNLQPVTCKVDKYCTAMVDKNRYSVPSCFCGIKVSVLVGVDRVDIYQKSKLIASHPRLYGNNKWQLEPDHYLDLLEERPGAFNSARPILQWRKIWPISLEKLLTRLCQSQGETKGIKDFINVLMLYRTFDAEDITAAVEMALESGISSSDGVHHLLLFARDTESHAPSLAQWDSLPPANMEQYSQLEVVR